MITFLRNPVFHLLLILSLGILGYSNTLNAPFNYDDTPNIVDNPIIKNLDFYITPAKASSYKGFAQYPLLINRYIGSLSFALNYKIHELDVTGYHVVNILIHLINALLIYWFINLIFITLASNTNSDRPLHFKNGAIIAFFSSILFVSHPIQTESVTYIVQRFASLATMFYILSITMYVKFRLTIDGANNNNLIKKLNVKALVYYLIALLAAVLAMKTKEIAFTLPVMIVLYEFLFFQNNTKRRILYLIPFILTMLIIPATLVFIAGLAAEGGEGMATRLATDMSRLDYLFTELRVIITYIRLIFLPVAQNLIYDYPIYHSIFAPEVLLSFMALFAIGLTVIYLFWRYGKSLPITKVILFGTAWFFVTLSVESSIIPIRHVIFEHRIYLPSFGIFLVIGILLLMITERSRQKWVKLTIFLSVIITAVVFTFVTYSRNNVWNDKIVFWQDVVNKSPAKWEPYYQLGWAYTEKGNYDMAIKYFKKVTSLNPSFADAYNILGHTYYKKGYIDKSIRVLKNAIAINPKHAPPHMNLANSYAAKGLVEEARNEMKIGIMLQNLK